MQRLLNRKEAAEYLNGLGLPSSPTTLARQAMTGSGAKIYPDQQKSVLQA